MRDPTVDALIQSLFWVAYLLSEEVVAYEYVVIRQAFMEGITHYETFEEIERSVNVLYFQFIYATAFRCCSAVATRADAL
jgi:hypothetical protein